MLLTANSEESIKVLLRIRPVVKDTVDRCVEVTSENSLTLLKAEPLPYQFDQVVAEDASQVPGALSYQHLL